MRRLFIRPLLVLPFFMMACQSDGTSPDPDPDPTPTPGVAELEPVQDNTIFEESGSLSNGSGHFLFVGITKDTLSRRALVKFDVSTSDIPSGATVDSVQFVLRMDRTIVGNTQVTVHRATEEWGEGASDAPAAEGTGTQAEAGDATWTHRFFETQEWGNPGGSFAAQASATQTVGDEVRAYVWSSSTLTNDVRGWRSNPASNFGWMIVGQEGNDITAKRFGAREEIAANRPKLRVFFTSP